MTTLDVLFAAVGLVTGRGAVLAVTTRQLVHAALWLVVTLGALAGCYLVLGAELVALVQLLVYVGAVVVLVLFALMLTRAPIGPQRRATPPACRSGSPARSWPRAPPALLGGVLLPALGGAGGAASHDGPHRRASPRRCSARGCWPFELLSLLLLVALVAAFAVSRMPVPDERAGRA